MRLRPALPVKFHPSITAVESLRPAFLLMTWMGLFFFTGCSSVEYKEGETPRMLVAEDQTPLFRNGPAQGNGPDLQLSKGDEVRVLRKEFGYSFVTTSNGGKGYVANEALVTAPPEPATALTEKSPPDPSTSQETLPGFRY